MKRTLTLTLLATVTSVLGCVGEPTSQPDVSATFPSVLVGDQKAQVVISESGDGTREKPLGVELDFVESKSGGSW